MGGAALPVGTGLGFDKYFVLQARRRSVSLSIAVAHRSGLESANAGHRDSLAGDNSGVGQVVS